jgi:hypothetical protein
MRFTGFSPEKLLKKIPISREARFALGKQCWD